LPPWSPGSEPGSSRTSRRVRLTPAGEELLQRLAPAYGQIQSALSELHEDATGIAGTLRLGLYSRVAGGPRLVEIVKTFEQRHPRCQVQLAETGLTPEQFKWLRRGDYDFLVYRLPLESPDLTVGPVLLDEQRILVLARDHPLAGRESVCVEDLADFTTTDVEGAPREVMDAFSPPFTPSGRPIHRTYVHSIGEVAIRAAVGELVHPTVPSFLKVYPQPELVSVPIRDLPPSQTALIRLRINKSAKAAAFIQAAKDVLGSQDRPSST
jgi:DNA-binding transcriptional LysR family regulator